MQFRILHVADLALVLLPFFFAKFSTSSQKQYTATWYSSSLHPRPSAMGAASKPEANWRAPCGESSSDFFSESASDSSCEERQRIRCQIRIQSSAGRQEPDLNIYRKCAEWNRLAEQKLAATIGWSMAMATWESLKQIKTYLGPRTQTWRP